MHAEPAMQSLERVHEPTVLVSGPLPSLGLAKGLPSRSKL